MGHAQIWAYCNLMTSAISIYGYKRDRDMGTNGACPNMGILYTDDISNIWSQKGQGLTDSEIQLSRATDPAAMPIYGHAHLAETSRATDPSLTWAAPELDHCKACA